MPGLVLPTAPGVCSHTGAEGLLLGALRCALIASHSTSAVLCGHGYTVICFTLFTRAICCQVAGVTSSCLANLSIKSTRACLKAALFTHGVLVDRRGKAIQGKVMPKRINTSTWWTFLIVLGPRHIPPEKAFNAHILPIISAPRFTQRALF